MIRMGWYWDSKKFCHGVLGGMVAVAGDGMVWYGAGTRKLGDGDGMVTGGGTEIKVSIPFHFDGNTIPTHYHAKPCKIRLLWRTRRCLTATYTGVTFSHEEHVCDAAATVPACFPGCSLT